MTNNAFHHQYDLLELYCFHNDNCNYFEEMKEYWGTTQKLSEYVEHFDIPAVEIFNRVISARDLQPLCLPGEDETHILPHVNYAIAAIMQEKAAYYLSSDEILHPEFAYVTQTSLLSCYKDDKDELLHFISSNFNVSLESHMGNIFKTDEDGYAPCDDFFEMLTSLSVLHRMEIYPPTSAVHYFENRRKISKALLGFSLPYFELTLPSPIRVNGINVPWSDLTWEMIWNSLKDGMIQIAGNALSTEDYDFVLRPYVGIALDPLHDLLFLKSDNPTGLVRAHLLNESIEYATPLEWLSNVDD
jgi:hypothetical protein